MPTVAHKHTYIHVETGNDVIELTVERVWSPMSCQRSQSTNNPTQTSPRIPVYLILEGEGEEMRLNEGVSAYPRRHPRDTPVRASERCHAGEKGCVLWR